MILSGSTSKRDKGGRRRLAVRRCSSAHGDGVAIIGGRIIGGRRRLCGDGVAIISDPLVGKKRNRAFGRLVHSKFNVRRSMFDVPDGEAVAWRLSTSFIGNSTFEVRCSTFKTAKPSPSRRQAVAKRCFRRGRSDGSLPVRRSSRIRLSNTNVSAHAGPDSCGPGS